MSNADLRGGALVRHGRQGNLGRKPAQGPLTPALSPREEGAAPQPLRRRPFSASASGRGHLVRQARQGELAGEGQDEGGLARIEFHPQGPNALDRRSRQGGLAMTKRGNGTVKLAAPGVTALARGYGPAARPRAVERSRVADHSRKADRHRTSGYSGVARRRRRRPSHRLPASARP